jgi:hypothetical protein
MEAGLILVVHHPLEEEVSKTVLPLLFQKVGHHETRGLQIIFPIVEQKDLILPWEPEVDAVVTIYKEPPSMGTENF